MRVGHVCITGAGSGLGRCLALRMANKAALISLIDINAASLNETAEAVRKLRGTVNVAVINVGDTAQMADWLSEQDDMLPIDCIIANAGVSFDLPPKALMEEPAVAASIVHTNVLGVINTIHPAIALMTKRRSGRVVLISSLSSVEGYPKFPVYAASKAFVTTLGKSLRPSLGAQGIRVQIVLPGFFESNMSTKQETRRPFCMTAEQAATLVEGAIQSGRPVTRFPLPLVATITLFSILPARWQDWLYCKMFIPDVISTAGKAT